MAKHFIIIHSMSIKLVYGSTEPEAACHVIKVEV
jgi:hypothetical protein